MGTRLFYLCLYKLIGDHPHAYGDKQDNVEEAKGRLGSSPRVWGQVLQFTQKVKLLGIIPTRMGTSIMVYVDTIIGEDHPHAYGDKTKEIKENSGFAKSTA